VGQLSEGDYVDPGSSPTVLLDQLKIVQDKVSAVRARLLGLSKWKEAITGRPHDLSGVTQ